MGWMIVSIVAFAVIIILSCIIVALIVTSKGRNQKACDNLISQYVESLRKVWAFEIELLNKDSSLKKAVIFETFKILIDDKAKTLNSLVKRDENLLNELILEKKAFDQIDNTEKKGNKDNYIP